MKIIKAGYRIKNDDREFMHITISEDDDKIIEFKCDDIFWLTKNQIPQLIELLEKIRNDE